MSEDSMGTNVFIVYGMRYNPQPAEDGLPAMEIEVLGAFNTYADAAVFKDISADFDTTLEAIGVTTTQLFGEVPDMEVMLHISSDPDYPGTVFIRSVGVHSETKPFLRDDNDSCFLALAYPEDKDAVIDYAVEWIVTTGKSPSVEEVVIVESISPEAQDLIDESA